MTGKEQAIKALLVAARECVQSINTLLDSDDYYAIHLIRTRPMPMPAMRATVSGCPGPDHYGDHSGIGGCGGFGQGCQEQEG